MKMLQVLPLFFSSFLVSYNGLDCKYTLTSLIYCLPFQIRVILSYSLCLVLFGYLYYWEGGLTTSWDLFSNEPQDGILLLCSVGTSLSYPERAQ